MTATALIALAATGTAANAAVPTDTSALGEAVTADAIMDHLAELQAIADANGGTRASGTPGYDAVDRLHRRAARGRRLRGRPSRSSCSTRSASCRSRCSSRSRPTRPCTCRARTSSRPSTRAAAMSPRHCRRSTSSCRRVRRRARRTAAASPRTSPTSRPATSRSCSAARATSRSRRERLRCRRRRRHHLQRGPGGAHRDPEPHPRRPVQRRRCPVVGTSFEIGNELAALLEQGEVVIHLETDTLIELDVPTANLIAETPTGRDDRVVMAGAHLDSVPDGPGHQRQRLRLGDAARDRAADGGPRHRAAQHRALRVVGRRGGRPRRVAVLRRLAHQARGEGHRAVPQLRHDRLAELRPVHLRRQRRRVRHQGPERQRATSSRSSRTTSPRRAWPRSRPRSTGARTTTRSSPPASRPVACSPAPRTPRATSRWTVRRPRHVRRRAGVVRPVLPPGVRQHGPDRRRRRRGPLRGTERGVRRGARVQRRDHQREHAGPRGDGGCRGARDPARTRCRPAR